MLFYQAPDISSAAEFKKGFIMRKCCVDPDGRKSKMIVFITYRYCRSLCVMCLAVLLSGNAVGLSLLPSAGQ